MWTSRGLPYYCWLTPWMVVGVACTGSGDGTASAGQTDAGDASTRAGDGQSHGGASGDGFIDAFCRLASRCRGFAFLPDEATCHSFASCTGWPLSAGAAVTQAELAACGAYFDSVDCLGPEMDVFGTPCEFLVDDDASLGGSCQGRDCAGGLDCETPAQAGTCAVCVERGGVGDACGADGCALDLYCDDSGRCAPRLDVGAACPDDGYSLACASAFCKSATCADFDGLGESCSGDSCGYGAMCVEGVCRIGQPEGTPCSSIGDCGILSACRDGACVAVCVDGEMAAGSCILLGNPCGEDEYCDESGYCMPLLKADDACLLVTSCESGSTCFNRSCEPQATVGDNCGRHEACASNFCDPFTNRCADPSTCTMP